MTKKILIAVLAVVFVGTLLFVVLSTGDDNKSEKDGSITTENMVQVEDEPTDKLEGPLYDYDLAEYVTLVDVKNITVDTEYVEDAVSKEIRNVVAKYAEKKSVVDRPVKNGDIVVMDYVGTKDGIAFEGGTANNAELEIGSNSYIPGFESGLVGANIGDEVKLDLTFPEEYRNNPDLAGAKVVFTVKVKAITEVVYPELTDSMVGALNSDNYKTAEEFKSFCTEEITKYYLWQKYVESCTVLKYPEKEFEYYKNQLVSYYTSMAAYNGLTLEQLVVSYMGFKNVDEFNSTIVEQVNVTVKNEMVAFQTARTNNIKVTDEEYQTEGLVIAKENGYDTLAELEESTGKEYIELQIMQVKTIDFVFESNAAQQ